MSLSGMSALTGMSALYPSGDPLPDDGLWGAWIAEESYLQIANTTEVTKWDIHMDGDTANTKPNSGSLICANNTFPGTWNSSDSIFNNKGSVKAISAGTFWFGALASGLDRPRGWLTMVLADKRDPADKGGTCWMRGNASSFIFDFQTWLITPPFWKTSIKNHSSAANSTEVPAVEGELTSNTAYIMTWGCDSSTTEWFIRANGEELVRETRTGWWDDKDSAITPGLQPQFPNQATLTMGAMYIGREDATNTRVNAVEQWYSNYFDIPLTGIPV